MRRRVEPEVDWRAVLGRRRDDVEGLAAGFPAAAVFKVCGKSIRVEVTADRQIRAEARARQAFGTGVDVRFSVRANGPSRLAIETARHGMAAERIGAGAFHA